MAVGVLVMAHGGSSEWNETVAAAVAPLSRDLPTVVALGMANPVALSSALDSLRSVGVSQVAVVRMFVSGQSFLDRTRYLLGLSDEPPETVMSTERGAGDRGALRPIDHGLAIATHEDGLMASAEARRIMAERARDLSDRPQSESVLLLAHGVGNEDENARLLQAMGKIEDEIARTPFRSVRGATLREDWTEKRTAAERQIRDFVRQEADAGRRVIVVPLRLSGFGPYAEVLAGLEYTPGEGLLPHRDVSTWLRQTASRVICTNGWNNPIHSCGAGAASTRLDEQLLHALETDSASTLPMLTRLSTS